MEQDRNIKMDKNALPPGGDTGQTTANYAANLTYLFAAIRFWMKGEGYTEKDAWNPDVPDHAAQLIDAESQIREVRVFADTENEQYYSGDSGWREAGQAEDRNLDFFFARTGRDIRPKNE
jgi:hypothetical protein